MKIVDQYHHDYEHDSNIDSDFENVIVVCIIDNQHEYQKQYVNCAIVMMILVDIEHRMQYIHLL
jgi:hypothetical protein